jgi:hypothetical protein
MKHFNIALMVILIGLNAHATEVKQGHWKYEVNIEGNIETRDTYVIYCSETNAQEAVFIGKDGGSSTDLTSSYNANDQYEWEASFFNKNSMGRKYALEMTRTNENLFEGRARLASSFKYVGSGKASYISNEVPEDLYFICD